MKTWITDAQGRKLYTVDSAPSANTQTPQQEPLGNIVECEPTEILVRLSKENKDGTEN